MENSTENMSHYINIINDAMQDETNTKLNESVEKDEEKNEENTEIPAGYSISYDDNGWKWIEAENESDSFETESEAINSAWEHYEKNKKELNEDEDEEDVEREDTDDESLEDELKRIAESMKK